MTIGHRFDQLTGQRKLKKARNEDGNQQSKENCCFYCYSFYLLFLARGEKWKQNATNNKLHRRTVRFRKRRIGRKLCWATIADAAYLKWKQRQAGHCWQAGRQTEQQHGWIQLLISLLIVFAHHSLPSTTTTFPHQHQESITFHFPILGDYFSLLFFISNWLSAGWISVFFVCGQQSAKKGTKKGRKGEGGYSRFYSGKFSAMAKNNIQHQKWLPKKSWMLIKESIRSQCSSIFWLATITTTTSQAPKPSSGPALPGIMHKNYLNFNWWWLQCGSIVLILILILIAPHSASLHNGHH